MKTIAGYKNHIRNAVRKFLQIEPTLRDDDNRLLSNIWHNHLNMTRRYSFTEEEWEGVMKFLKIIADGDMPHWESVRRCRQKLQEDNPDLRGRLWDKRHKAEKSVKAEIRRWDQPEHQEALL